MAAGSPEVGVALSATCGSGVPSSDTPCAVLRLDARKFGSERPRPLLQALVLRGLLFGRLCALIDCTLFVTQRRDTIAIPLLGCRISALEPDRRIAVAVSQGAAVVKLLFARIRTAPQAARLSSASVI